jgi:hypothetical protein
MRHLALFVVLGLAIGVGVSWLGDGRFGHDLDGGAVGDVAAEGEADRTASVAVDSRDSTALRGQVDTGLRFRAEPNFSRSDLAGGRRIRTEFAESIARGGPSFHYSLPDRTNDGQQSRSSSTTFEESSVTAE